MRVEIGPMLPEHARQVGLLHHRTWVNTYGDVLPSGYWRQWTPLASVRRWQELLAEPVPRRMVRRVARVGSRVVGFAVRGPVRDRPGIDPVRPTELHALYVDVTLYGSGVGQGLMDAAVDGVRPAEVWVWEGNERAIAFYARNGFAADGARFVDERFPQLDQIRMVR